MSAQFILFVNTLTILISVIACYYEEPERERPYFVAKSKDKGHHHYDGIPSEDYYQDNDQFDDDMDSGYDYHPYKYRIRSYALSGGVPTKNAVSPHKRDAGIVTTEESALTAMDRSSLEGLTRFGKGMLGVDADFGDDLEDDSWKKFTNGKGEPVDARHRPQKHIGKQGQIKNYFHYPHYNSGERDRRGTPFRRSSWRDKSTANSRSNRG